MNRLVQLRPPTGGRAARTAAFTWARSVKNGQKGRAQPPTQKHKKGQQLHRYNQRKALMTLVIN